MNLDKLILDVAVLLKLFLLLSSSHSVLCLFSPEQKFHHSPPSQIFLEMSGILFSEEINLHMHFSESTNGKEPVCQCRRYKGQGFDPWVGKIPSRRAWQPTPIFLPGKAHGQRSLADASSAKSTTSSGVTELDTTEMTCYSLQLCIQMGISFLFSFAFCFSSFQSSLYTMLRQLLCLFTFLFLGDGFDPCLLHYVTNLCP